MWFLWENYGIKALTKFLIHYTLNPLHPNISTHILQTVLNTFPVVLERRIRLTLRASSVGDYFLYSHNFHVWLKDDIIRRNWMLITFGAKRLYQHNHIWWEAKVMASFGAWNITNPFIICVHILLNMNFHYGIEHQFAQIFVQCFSFLDVNEKGIFFTKYVSSFYFKYAPLIIVWVSSKDRIITYVDIWLVHMWFSKPPSEGYQRGRSGRLQINNLCKDFG